MIRSRTRCLPAVSALGALGLAALWQSAGVAAEAPPAPSAAPANTNDARETEGGRRAAERAQQALEAKHQWIPGLQLESVAATEWSDSSLGCRKPGMSYMQVITSGYTVKFVGKDARREVHVTDNNAVVCEVTPGGIRMPPKTAARVPLRNLQLMLAAAREDLAMRLGAKPDDIKVLNWSSVDLPARVLRCEVATADPAEPAVPGYKILLEYHARPYAYFSDLQNVTACPRIERR